MMLITFMFFVKPKDGAQRLTDLPLYFWSNKKTKNLTKKFDISHRKFKNIESPKRVSKRLNGHYLRSYEQFQKKIIFKGDFQAKGERKNRIYLGIFEHTKIKKKLIKKWDISFRKLNKEELQK